MNILTDSYIREVSKIGMRVIRKSCAEGPREGQASSYQVNHEIARHATLRWTGKSEGGAVPPTSQVIAMVSVSRKQLVMSSNVQPFVVRITDELMNE